MAKDTKGVVIPDITDDFEETLRQSISPAADKGSSPKTEVPPKAVESKPTKSVPPDSGEVADKAPAPPSSDKGPKKKSTHVENELDFILTNVETVEKRANVKLSETKLRKIKKYMLFLGGPNVGIQGYIENVLALHFEQHEAELKRRLAEAL